MSQKLRQDEILKNIRRVAILIHTDLCDANFSHLATSEQRNSFR